jgi:CheY-like chemotaxis protein/glycine cleavage system H lipoate-binding protein
MTVLLVIIMLLAFVGIDYLVRETSRRLREKRQRAAREEILKVAVRLDIAGEVKTLKRIEVPEPRARILAVDDEGIVLDSFRRILVLEGYNVDTVENGPEALNLVQRHDYDFVFTDLKMPIMDGVEVVKAVKHLRPDVDVVVITGYATIETAVETMKHGASEYVQKPFTAEELSEFVNRLLVKRQARLNAQKEPTVRIVSPSQAEGAPEGEFCVPGGSFIAGGHTWVRIEPDGQVRVGIDDFAHKAMGAVSEVVLPDPGTAFKAGDALFSFKRGAEQIRFYAPIAGKVVEDNARLRTEPTLVASSPYKDGWVCRIKPSDLAAELAGLKIGRPVVEWYGEEIKRLRELKAGNDGQELGWTSLEDKFLK